MRRNPLPATAPHIFRVADAANLGITVDRLRASDLDASVWGVRATSPVSDIRHRCLLFAKRLRGDAVISHTTAALLYGAPLDFSFEADPRVHFTTPLPASAPHAKGIVGHRARLDARDIRTLKGLRLTSPTRTWIDLGRLLTLGDLVAVGDHLVLHRAPWTDLSELREAATGFSGRGSRVLKQAAALLDDHAESRPESRLRVIIVTAGLPIPTINHTLVDSETGKQLRPDFTFRAHRVLIEYQGDYHRTRAQWRKDMTRRSRLESMGWKVMELNADDLTDPIELAARIRARFAVA